MKKEVRNLPAHSHGFKNTTNGSAICKAIYPLVLLDVVFMSLLSFMIMDVG